MAFEILLFLLLGLAAGVTSGLLGVGGGILMTPVLHYVFGHSWATAVAWSLTAITVQSPLGVWKHHQRGAVRMHLAVPLVVSGLVGVLVGAWLFGHVPVRWLKFGFALVMFLAAWRLVAKVPERQAPMGRALIVVAGLVAGIASRLFGIGGGLVTVPILTLGGVPVHHAVGSSLVPVFTSAALATILHIVAGIPVWWGLVLGAGGLIGAPLGVRLAHAVPATGLQRVFAGALAGAALYVGGTSGVW